MTEQQIVSAYFTYCKLQKNLDNKTLKAYQIDLKQFLAFYPKPTTVTRTDMELYIEHLMERYKPSTVKRKIAALKAYYHYLVYEEILDHSPFEKIQLHIRQEVLLPRTIDRQILGAIFSAAYRELSTAHSKVARQETIRNIAVLELYFWRYDRGFSLVGFPIPWNCVAHPIFLDCVSRNSQNFSCCTLTGYSFKLQRAD